MYTPQAIYQQPSEQNQCWLATRKAYLGTPSLAPFAAGHITALGPRHRDRVGSYQVCDTNATRRTGTAKKATIEIIGQANQQSGKWSATHPDQVEPR